MKTVVVVGGSLAGIRAAEMILAKGFPGKCLIISREPEPAYERPPLSKQVITKGWEFDQVSLDVDNLESLEITRGKSAISLDVASKVVTLSDETKINYDGLIIATGCEPRLLSLPCYSQGNLPNRSNPSPALVSISQDLDNVLTLRTFGDAAKIRSRVAGNSKVVIIGAGFIGLELSSSLSQIGAKVTLIDPLDGLLQRTLGGYFSSYFEGLVRSNGIALQLGTTPTFFAIDSNRQVTGVATSSGEIFSCDLVIVAIGVIPSTAWLADSNVLLHPKDHGVVCNKYCQVMSKAGAPIENVFACGDVAWWHNELFDGPMRIEHFENAVSMGRCSGSNLVARPGDLASYTEIPFFWSDMFGKKIQYVGRSDEDSELEFIEGNLASDKFLAIYSNQGRITAAIGVGRPAKLMKIRTKIGEGASIDAIGTN